MKTQVLNSEGIFCWVCVFKSANTKKHCIIYTNNVEKYVEQHKNDNLKLVYTRGFADIIDGLGHKLFLEALSATSRERFIKLWIK